MLSFCGSIVYISLAAEQYFACRIVQDLLTFFRILVNGDKDPLLLLERVLK